MGGVPDLTVTKVTKFYDKKGQFDHVKKAQKNVLNKIC